MATENDFNFITSLDLRNTVIPQSGGELVQHFVYASSLYGTAFGVFCGVNGVEATDKSSFKIIELQLRIINYTGVVNIGFLHGNGLQPARNTFDSGDKRIDFAVQGANINRELTIPIDLDIKEPITLIFQRTLHPLVGFNEINDRPDRGTEQVPAPIPNEPVFDTEFNYRNGVDFYYNPLRPGMYNFPGPADLPSPRCHKSFVRCVYKC